jgi:PhzF family phenazine biosynthesis protein
VNAFTLTSGVEGGNPAGVVLNADELSDSEKQEIAREIGYSETAFVSSSDVAGFKLDFFTPTKQIPDCGHATIAAFSVLSRQLPYLRETSKEILGGKIRDISIRHGKVFMKQPAAVLAEENLAEAQKLFENQPQFQSAVIARADNGFLVLELVSERELSSLRARQDKIQAYSEKHGLVGLYIYSSSKAEATQYATRMFAPAYGINEESATGVAAGLLSSVLHAKGLDNQFVINQGLWMNPVRPSRIWTQVSADAGRVEVGGYATVE